MAINKDTLPDEEVYFTPDEVAALFAVTVQTIRKWIKSGRLGHTVLAESTIRISRAQVKECGVAKYGQSKP